MITDQSPKSPGSPSHKEDHKRDLRIYGKTKRALVFNHQAASLWQSSHGALFATQLQSCELSVVCPPDKLRKHAFTGRIFINDCDDRRRKVRISTPIDTMAAHMAALPLTQASLYPPPSPTTTYGGDGR